MYLTLILLIGNEQNNAVPVRKLFKKKIIVVSNNHLPFQLKGHMYQFYTKQQL